MKPEKIRFTKHAADKIEFLKEYGFDVTEALVRHTVAEPSRVDQRDD